jgi:hypothetical protein
MADSFLKSLNRILTGGTPLYQLQAGAIFAAPAIFTSGIQVVAPAAVITPNLLLGPHIRMTFAANTVVSIAIPTGIPAGLSADFDITIINTSGGNLTNITFVAAYKNAALTYPATANNRTFAFWTDGTNAYEKYQTAADVAN